MMESSPQVEHPPFDFDQFRQGNKLLLSQARDSSLFDKNDSTSLLGYLRENPKIITCDLSNCGLSSEFVTELLRQNKTLKTLSLANNPRVFNTAGKQYLAVGALSDNQALRNIDLSNNPLLPHHISTLADNRTLEILGISGTGLTDNEEWGDRAESANKEEWADKVAKMPIKHLNISHNKITGKAAVILLKSKSIETLDLSNNTIEKSSGLEIISALTANGGVLRNLKLSSADLQQATAINIINNAFSDIKGHSIAQRKTNSRRITGFLFTTGLLLVLAVAFALLFPSNTKFFFELFSADIRDFVKAIIEADATAVSFLFMLGAALFYRSAVSKEKIDSSLETYSDWEELQNIRREERRAGKTGYGYYPGSGLFPSSFSSVSSSSLESDSTASLKGIGSVASSRQSEAVMREGETNSLTDQQDSLRGAVAPRETVDLLAQSMKTVTIIPTEGEVAEGQARQNTDNLLMTS